MYFERITRSNAVPCGQRGSRGFTLVELVIAMAILAILASLAVPSYRSSALNNRQRSAANELLTLLHTARNEATKQGTFNVVVCSSIGVSSGCSGNDGDAWKQGVLVFVDSETVNTALDSGERVVTFSSGIPGNLTIKTNKDKFVFTPFVAPTHGETNGTITICDSRDAGQADAAHARAVVVSTSGRARIKYAGDDGVTLSCT